MHANLARMRHHNPALACLFRFPFAALEQRDNLVRFRCKRRTRRRPTIITIQHDALEPVPLRRIMTRGNHHPRFTARRRRRNPNRWRRRWTHPDHIAPAPEQPLDRRFFDHFPASPTIATHGDHHRIALGSTLPEPLAERRRKPHRKLRGQTLPNNPA